jgi:hypothetical protein
VWNGFFQLDRSRPMLAMHGPLAIQEAQIEAWLNIHGIADVSTRIWHYELFVAMDRIRLAQLHKDQGDGKGAARTDKDAHAAPAGKPKLGAASGDVHLQGPAPGDA